MPDGLTINWPCQDEQYNLYWSTPAAFTSGSTSFYLHYLLPPLHMPFHLLAQIYFLFWTATDGGQMIPSPEPQPESPTPGTCPQSGCIAATDLLGFLREGRTCHTEREFAAETGLQVPKYSQSSFWGLFGTCIPVSSTAASFPLWWPLLLLHQTVLGHISSCFNVIQFSTAGRWGRKQLQFSKLPWNLAGFKEPF